MVTALAILLLALWPGTGTAADDDVSYRVTIDEGLAPQMRAEEAAQIAVAHLRKQIRSVDVDPKTGEAVTVPAAPVVLEVRCLTLDRIFERWTDENGVDRRLVWLVVARGEFVNHRTPPGEPSSVHDSGWLAIEDETGKIVGFGSNEPARGSVPPPEARDPLTPEP